MGWLGLYLWVAGTPLQFRQGEEGTESVRIFSRRMGFSPSKNRQMFIEILLHMLAHRGIKVSTGRLSKFLHLFYTLHEPENVPVDAFALWNMIRDILDPQHEAVRQPMGEATVVDGGSPPSVQIMFSAIDKKIKKGGRLCSTYGGEGGLAGCCGWAHL